MRKTNKLMIFASILTMFAYVGCGASTEMTNSIADAPVAEAPAMAEADAEADGILSDARGFADDAGSLADDVDGFAGDADVALSKADIALGEAEKIADKADAILNDIDGIWDEDIIAEPVPEPEPELAKDSIVGMLTAGEWKDHDNWGFFSNLVNTGVIAFPSFGLDPTQRIAVTVTDSSGTPLPNVEIALNNDTGIIWKSLTDKNGKAYVFEMNGQIGSNLTATQGEISQTIEIDSSSVDEQGNVQTTDREYSIQFEAEPKLYSDTQIMFIVDTTGSMGDEMLYLQSDFSAIAEEAGDDYTSYSVNFYKDEGDEYVTNCSGFTNNIDAIKKKLNSEFASGGGDEPEAVYEILKETVFSPEWKEDSVKIAFLIYDAPPHNDKEFQEIIEEASAKGIHIVPVVSSNGSRETELFGRALAICTNGSYVFLTDDSGVGSSHLEPIIGEHDVEPLHDIIVRIIQDYKQ